MPTTRRSTKQHSNDPQSTKKSASPKNREKQKQPVEKPCYILLYNCSKNNDVLVPIYIDEELGEIFMKNMNLVKLIEIKTKTVVDKIPVFSDSFCGLSLSAYRSSHHCIRHSWVFCQYFLLI